MTTETAQERDARCLLALQNNGTDAGEEFTELYLAYKSYLDKIVRGYTNNNDDFHDVLGEVHMYLWEKLAVERREADNVAGFFSNAAKWKSLDFVNKVSPTGKARREVLASDMTVGSGTNDAFHNESLLEDVLAVDAGGWRTMDDGHLRNEGGKDRPIMTINHDLSEGLEQEDTLRLLGELISTLPTKRQAPIQALVEGGTANEVSAEFDVPLKTLYRWFVEYQTSVKDNEDIAFSEAQ